MNERKTKGLKELVFGDFSSKQPNYTQGHDGSVRCVGRRAAYQRLKKDSHTQSGGSKHIYKGKNRPRWLHPKKKGQKLSNIMRSMKKYFVDSLYTAESIQVVCNLYLQA